MLKSQGAIYTTIIGDFMWKVYGIKRCSKVQKALALFDACGVAYQFIDYQKNVPSVKDLQGFADDLGLDKIFNQNSTTYKQLDNKNQDAYVLMHANPSIIKRPLIVKNGQAVLTGFDENALRALFGKG